MAYVSDGLSTSGLQGQLSQKGLVFIVEDCEIVRLAVKKICQANGYECRVAANANEAVQTFDLHGKEFTAVICDLGIPGADGLALAEQFRERRAETPILLVSGADSKDARNFCAHDDSLEFLKKPFTSQNLFDSLSRITLAG